MSEDSNHLTTILRDATAKLSEHFDNIQIFANKLDDGVETVTGHTYGAGNYFARYGQVREWLVEKDAYTAAKGKSDYKKDTESE